ncbi:unnamed protein product [Notodromas monacha]|uniref:Uncharacterized protein n=1 Tax=Notodromas monacha TaxID=399045 RepID=A0A7R9BKW2_9CRUS|nr:unnamed protein product [Notodromas monacha]CAG0917363.1 unnamed protein product [Notodromas monacha]
MVVRSVLTLVASLILIIGVLKERRLLMLPWLLVSAVSIGGWTVSAIVLPLGLASMDSASQGEGDGFGPLFILVVGIIMSMVVVVGTFMFLTPLSHYQVLSSLESLRHGIEAKSEGFRNANNGHDPTMIPLTDMEHA